MVKEYTANFAGEMMLRILAPKVVMLAVKLMYTLENSYS
jgi:hypothetical protein